MKFHLSMLILGACIIGPLACAGGSALNDHLLGGPSVNSYATDDSTTSEDSSNSEAEEAPRGKFGNPPDSTHNGGGRIPPWYIEAPAPITDIDPPSPYKDEIAINPLPVGLVSPSELDLEIKYF